ncbi:MAG: hypothetical protein P8X74_03885 [Reinekea sp.]
MTKIEQKQKAAQYIAKLKKLKKLLKKNKHNLSWFWLEYIADPCLLSYSGFSNIMNGRYDQERKDVIEIVDRYLEGGGDD